MVTRKLTSRQNDIAPMRLHIGQAALKKNRGVVANNRIDAGGLIAGQDDAGQHKRNDVFAVKQRFPRRLSAGGRFGPLRRGGRFHFLQFQLPPVPRSRERSSAARAASVSPRRKASAAIPPP